MLLRTFVWLALLLHCQVAFCQESPSPRQVYENYLKASVKNEDVSQFLLSPDKPAKKQDFPGLAEFEKVLGEKNTKALKDTVSDMNTSHMFLNESVDGGKARLLYGLGYDKEGYTEIAMETVNGAWKIKRIDHFSNMKPPAVFTSQKLINQAFAATQRQFPKVPVHGKVGGAEFRPSEIKLWDGANKGLQFSYPTYNASEKDVCVFFHGRKKSVLNARMAQTEIPPYGSDSISVWVCEKGKKTKILDSGSFGIQLAFGLKDAKGLVPGYIIMYTFDPGTYIEGYFYARIPE